MKQAPRLVRGSMVLFLAFCSWGLWYLATHYEFQTRWRNLGPVPEAIRNPYHSAKRFLTAAGFDVRSASVLPEIIDRLEKTDAVFLFYDHDIEYQTLRDKIDRWVESGGHLVMTVHYLWDEENQASGDRFLDDLGVRQRLWQDLTEEDPEEPAEDEENSPPDVSSEDAMSAAPEQEASRLPVDLDGDPVDRLLENLNRLERVAQDADTLCSVQYDEPLASIVLTGAALPLQLAFEPDYHIDDASGQARSPFSSSPVHLLEYRRGAGRITVLTDHYLFNDDNLGDYDHAFLLWSLAQESPRVWIIHDTDTLSLLGLMWQSAPWLLTLGGLWLGAWLLYRGRRFGPLRVDAPQPRRQLLEHIDASAAYLWRNDHRDRLVAQAREHLFARFPGLETSGIIPLRLQNAADSTGISREKLLWALNATDIDSDDDFIEVVRLLQLIRMSL